jgi:hypothetical protein
VKDIVCCVLAFETNIRALLRWQDIPIVFHDEEDPVMWPIFYAM